MPTISQKENDVPLSIIIPVYQVERYIRPCIESVFRQGLKDKDFELIIVNDGTKDQSMEMITDIIDQHSNITVINQTNQGLSVARNNGIVRARGEYILMPDSDDMLVTNSLPFLLEKALSSKADIVVADFLRIDNKEMDQYPFDSIVQKDGTSIEKTGEELFLQDLNPHECYVWRTLFRRDFLLRHHLTFFPGIRCQDVPFTHECYLKARKCLRVSWLLNIYRQHRPFAASSSHDVKKGKEISIAIAKTWELTKLNLKPELERKLKNDIYASFCYNLWMTTKLKTMPERYEVVDILREAAPSLSFDDGIKQKLNTFLYHHAPHVLINLRIIYGKIVKNE
ncbi:Glycosyl transferase family 2 [Prevotella aff. ruminicola Tc2-24]|uniref:Glycosyl transferase family 2 n=1 Tax=Prevotella aff. ruminicola Tc2-24 TaxID=81582 RepID=A0A1I0NSW9_9BACT|nr:glycosyltransferase [Prevotella aff. ruminicola Tc2-24]SEW04545.1 Glycosyl transferase family 2 [Prevotella aff. ruminicola Tc2-24]